MMPKDTPILLVDDSLAMRQTIKTVLQEAGFTDLDIASNGKEALGKITTALQNNHMYRVILLDWNMPEMDGMELLKICRGELALKDVAIVMLTAVSDQKSVISALGSGATSYITKPVSAEIILKKIDQIGTWLASQRRHP